MAQIFISYSRSDKPRTKKLIPLLRDIYGHENVWWDEDFVGGQIWWGEILKQIAFCDVFVFLLSPRSLGSPYCLAEFEEARRLRKPIIPVKFRHYTDVPEALKQLYYLELVGNINHKSIVPVQRAINKAASLPKSNELPLSDITVSQPIVPVREQLDLMDYAAQIITAIVTTIIGGIILAYIIQADRFDPTRFSEQATTVVEASLPQPTLQLVPPLTSTATSIRTATEQYFVNLTETQLFAAISTETAIETETQRAIEVTTTSVILLAERGVTSNNEWTPYTQGFNGIEMVLVPAGCFDMGNDHDWSDTYPIHEVCFDMPFWIDRYEVSNAQFTQLDGVARNPSRWTDANLPREDITWFEARDFCALRDARLPTEAEWEYAARGPDNLIYPWGNEFNGTELNFCDTNCINDSADDSFDDGYADTAPVDAFANGHSWVGAEQLSGNVSEWVSTIYDGFPYPYATDDGREEINRRGPAHVFRGGSWTFVASASHATYRMWSFPILSSIYTGVRCARSL